MASPVEQRALGYVVVGEVVLRDGGIQALFYVAEIFVGDRFAIVFQMTGDKELPAVLAGNQMHARGVGHGENLKLRMGQDILAVHLGVAAVRGKEFVVKASHQRVCGGEQLVPEHTGKLLRQLIFRDAEVVIQSGLRTPADVHGGVHMGHAPIHDGAQLFPVVHLLKGHVLHRSACDDHTVEAFVPKLVEGFIESL